MSDQQRPSRNTSVPKMPDPRATYPILVSRGEPRRDDEQLREIMAAQMIAFVNVTFSEADRPGDAVLIKAVALISSDHIDPPGTQIVLLSAEHARMYLQVAQKFVEANDA